MRWYSNKVQADRRLYIDTCSIGKKGITTVRGIVIACGIMIKAVCSVCSIRESGDIGDKCSVALAVFEYPVVLLCKAKLPTAVLLFPSDVEVGWLK